MKSQFDLTFHHQNQQTIIHWGREINFQRSKTYLKSWHRKIHT